MKYLLVLVFVVVVLWLWSNNRRIEKKQADESRRPRQAPTTQLTEIVACDVCQVHLPRSDALIGDKGVYCSDAHRRQANR
jgi:uncharacterized protein